MKSLLTILVAFVITLSTPVASAMPPLQHRVDGVLKTINPEKLAIVVDSGKNDHPTTFAIQAGRTRFRRDGKSVTLEQLPVGVQLRLYYRREVGQDVATEISWKAASPTARTPAQNELVEGKATGG